MLVRGDSVPARKAGTAAQRCQAAESCADSKQSIPGAAGEVAWNAAVSSPPRKTRIQRTQCWQHSKNYSKKVGVTKEYN